MPPTVFVAIHSSLVAHRLSLIPYRCWRGGSIYRCEALEGIVSYTREGQEVPDEYVRIDIRGKAFVYVSLSLRVSFEFESEL